MIIYYKKVKWFRSRYIGPNSYGQRYYKMEIEGKTRGRRIEPFEWLLFGVWR